MTDLRDPFVPEGPFTHERPRDPNARTVVNETERGEDEQREGVMHELLTEQAHGLTDDEKRAAEHHEEQRKRTYAPASERVAKPPAPGDDRVIEEGLHHPASPEDARHPGDRSDPSELR